MDKPIKIDAIWPLLDHLSPYNAIQLSEVQGTFSQQQIRTAVNWLQAKHPLLQYSVAKNEDAYYLVKIGQVEIPVLTHQFISYNEVRHFINDLLQKRFEENTPWACFCWLKTEQQPNTNYLISCVHHGIIDGNSIMSLHNELLHLCDILANKQALSTPEPLPLISPNTVNHFKQQLKQPFAFFKFLRVFASIIFKELKYRPQPIVNKLPQVQETGQTQFYTKNLSAAATQKLQEFTKKHKLSLHSVMVAAHFIGIIQYKKKRAQETWQSKTSSFKCFTPVDLRRLFIPKMEAHHLGCHVSAIGHSHCLPNNASINFIEVAREVKQQLKASFKKEEPFFVRKYGPWFTKQAIKKNDFKPAAMSISTLGTLTVGEGLQHYQLLDNSFYVTNNGLIHPNFSLVAAYVNKQYLSLDYSYDAAIFNALEIRDLVAEVVAVLEQVTQEK